MFLRIFRHLLPNARAWRLVVDKKLRSFFEGLGGSGGAARAFFDGVYLDLFPQGTRELSAWEEQFALPDTGLNEQDRRDRLAATWRAVGGQDPRYIQDTLRGRGFDVYVHEWWQPGTEPALGGQGCAVPRNPLLVLVRGSEDRSLLVECGQVEAECGEDFALAGNSTTPRGYALVNKVVATIRNTLPLCGEETAVCGEETAACGQYSGFRQQNKEYFVPLESERWPYFLYIGGPEFGDVASIPDSRRDEFEELCLKICPNQQWLGILVEYA